MTPEISTISSYLGYRRDIRYAGKDTEKLSGPWNDVENINQKTDEII
jgi:hypothetical protein